MTTKTWFITGGTPGGFGMAYADAALEIGDRVVLTARRPAELETWARAYGDRVLVLPLDVTDASRCRTRSARPRTHFGGIDVLVNNAGRGWYGSIEGTADADVRAMFELNFFALLSVIRAALPACAPEAAGGSSTCPRWRAWRCHRIRALQRDQVRRRGSHRGSPRRGCAAGHLGDGGGAGAFRTHAYAGFADEPVAESIAEYRPMLEQVRSAMVEQDGTQPGDPQRGVRAVIAAMAQDPPPRRLVLGSGGFDTVVATLESSLAEIRAREPLSRGADFPTD